jgi:2'-5' RNA ligase
MLLDDLFDELCEYIRDHQLEMSVQLQSRESLHITIYYLDAVLSDSEQSACRDLLDSWETETRTDISLGNIGYFYRKTSPYILYIASDNIAYFTHKNKQASEQLHRNDILENQFLFAPHITIMRILDAEGFDPHSDTIENMIQSHIE